MTSVHELTAEAGFAVVFDSQMLVLDFNGTPMIHNIRLLPLDKNKIATTIVASPSELGLVDANTDDCNESWAELFEELLETACCKSGIAIHYIHEDEHKIAVNFLVKGGVLSRQVPYPANLYTE